MVGGPKTCRKWEQGRARNSGLTELGKGGGQGSVKWEYLGTLGLESFSFENLAPSGVKVILTEFNNAKDMIVNAAKINAKIKLQK